MIALMMLLLLQDPVTQAPTAASAAVKAEAAKVAALERKLLDLESQLLEKDRQLASAQYKSGMAAIETTKALLEAEANYAQCTLQTRATPLIQQLTVVDKPLAGSTWNFQTSKWVAPKPPTPPATPTQAPK